MVECAALFHPTPRRPSRTPVRLSDVAVFCRPSISRHSATHHFLKCLSHFLARKKSFPNNGLLIFRRRSPIGIAFAEEGLIAQQFNRG